MINWLNACHTVLASIASLQYAVHSPMCGSSLFPRTGLLDWALFRLLLELIWAIPPVRGSSLFPLTGLLDWALFQLLSELIWAIPPMHGSSLSQHTGLLD